MNRNKSLTTGCLMMLQMLMGFNAYGQTAESKDWLVVNEIQASNLDMFINPQYNFSAWVELYNPTNEDISLAGLYFTDDPTNLKKWKGPQDMGTVESKGHYIVWFEDQNITESLPNFKLDADGGNLLISDDTGRILLQHAYPKAFSRTSYARTTDGGSEWKVCPSPTPGATNEGAVFVESRQLALPTIDQPSQVFTVPICVHVDFPAGSTLRYTTDGSVPTLENGQTSITGDFLFAQTTCLRVRAFQEGWIPSNIAVRSFLWSEMPIGNEETGMTVGQLTLPILSVVSDERFFYDDMIGTMVKGQNGLAGNGMDEPCNWNQEWPRAASFSYFNDGEKPDYNDDAIFEISGAWSRAHEPHPFKLKGNKVFGHGKTFNYPFFSQKPFIRNRTLQMRNGVDTYDGRPAERFKDAFLSYIIWHSGLNIEMQSYQPVAHFINGEYKGVIDMREPNNKHYVFANHGWGEDKIDMFEAEEPDTLIVSQGDMEAFRQLYALSFHAGDESSYNRIRQMLDIDEYINYMALELYIGNNDWIANNMKWFRHHEDGPFRIVLFDLDAAFNKYGMVSDWLTTTFEGWQMPTFFLNLMENDGFRRQFIDTYCLMGGSIFWPELTKQLSNEAKDRIENDLQAQGESAEFMVGYIDKWLVPYSNAYHSFIKKFEQARLSDTEAYRLHIYGNPLATVLLNGLVVPNGQYHGWFFPPVRVEAIAPAGMRCAGWKDAQTGNILTGEAFYDVPADYTTLVPLFVELDDSERQATHIHDVMINEVSAANNSYVNDHFKRNDWVELYNTTNHDIDIQGMFLSNDSTRLQLHILGNDTPEELSAPNTIIPARGHLIVWCDNLESRGQLHAPFKLSKTGGYLCLTASDGSWTETLFYPPHDEQHTLGRYPDGAPDTYLMNVATIGKPNMRTSYNKKYHGTRPSLIENIQSENSLALHLHQNELLVENKLEPSANVEVKIYSQTGILMLSATLTLHDGWAPLPTQNLASGCFIAIATTPSSKATCHFCQ